ncbi:unnamed protein product [Vitrella brassicaformis CCMP3155]|uniref:Uncharacterized protein n=1 Tax=Vitrella brassicaformis (strain CCMP3155) TaxID=1169540 RepID=A0A0G4G7B4_VITBC|nr:unnamed protein product [Vitrella brassicaformis CCMP3155]|eukprot:CEM24438.1 unnamed protein product [Vitrella brassicaformis CCMP3155]
MLDYGGAGGLQHRLRQTGLVFNVDVSDSTSSAATLIFIRLRLSTKGTQLCKSPQNVGDCVAPVFRALELLQRPESQAGGVPKCGLCSLDCLKSDDDVSSLEQAFFEAFGQLLDVSYNNEEEFAAVDALADAAANLFFYPKEECFSIGHRVHSERVNTTLVKEVLGQLTTDRCNVIYVDNHFDQSTKEHTSPDMQTFLFGPYGVRYTKQRLDVRLPPPEPADSPCLPINQTTSPCLPCPRVSCVPRNMTVIDPYEDDECPSSEMAPPCNVLHSDGLIVWWKGPARFRTPNIDGRFLLRLNKTHISPRMAVYAVLHVYLTTEDATHAIADKLTCEAGVSWDYEFGCFTLSAWGYAEHFWEVVSTVSSLFGGVPDPNPDTYSRIQLILDEMMGALQAASSESLYQIAEDLLTDIEMPNKFSNTALLEEVTKLSQMPVESVYEDYRTYVQNVATRSFVDALIVGNIDIEDAVELSEAVAINVRQAPVSLPEAVNFSSWMPNNSLELRLSNPIEGDSNHVILNAYQWGIPDFGQRAVLGIIDTLIATPVFESLRTEQQLGYIVSGGVGGGFPILELRIIVQGSSKDPDEMDERIEELLAQVRSKWATMTMADYAMERMPSVGPCLHSQSLLRAAAGRDSIPLAFLLRESKSPALLNEVMTLMTEPSPIRRKISIKIFGGGKDVKRTKPFADVEKDTQVLYSLDRQELLKLYRNDGLYPAEAKCYVEETSVAPLMPALFFEILPEGFIRKLLNKKKKKTSDPTTGFLANLFAAAPTTTSTTTTTTTTTTPAPANGTSIGASVSTSQLGIMMDSQKQRDETSADTSLPEQQPQGQVESEHPSDPPLLDDMLATSLLSVDNPSLDARSRRARRSSFLQATQRRLVSPSGSVSEWWRHGRAAPKAGSGRKHRTERAVIHPRGDDDGDLGMGASEHLNGMDRGQFEFEDEAGAATHPPVGGMPRLSGPLHAVMESFQVQNLSHRKVKRRRRERRVGGVSQPIEDNKRQSKVKGAQPQYKLPPR